MYGFILMHWWPMCLTAWLFCWFGLIRSLHQMIDHHR